MPESTLLESGIALITLTLLEIVLGIDNILVLSIMTNRLPKHRQAAGRFIGLLGAMGMRVLLLVFMKAILGLTRPLFAVAGQEVSGRDLILIAGGLFLLAKAVYEIHQHVEGRGEERRPPTGSAVFIWVIVQIMLLDLVFSLDSVITAVGMARELWVMITAIVVAILMMMLFAGPIGRFIQRHPTLAVLALSFLVLIGVTLIVEGCGGHVDKAYLYFAMGFSLVVELLNLRVLRRYVKRRPPTAPAEA
ncbi:MAG: TerC family protein [Planctomycetota bacterium]|nr:TerC family protein [Planctomycetota bacterium]